MSMERLLKVSDISERYGCTAKTARKYLRQMFHYENPLTAPAWALAEWEQSRERMPADKKRRADFTVQVSKTATRLISTPRCKACFEEKSNRW